MSENNQASGSFLSELKRRKVLRTCFVYVLVCWGVLQVLDIVADPLEFEYDVASRYFIYGAVLGFPVTFAIAWFFQFSAHGITRTDAFVERRVLSNIPPVNDRRRVGVSGYFRKDEQPEYRWIVSAETGPLSGLSFGIAKPVVIGRALECDLAVVTPHISRQHAKLDVENDQLYIEDMGSANGTIVNGKRAAQRKALHNEDEIRFHDVIFRVTENFVGSYAEESASSQTTFIQAPSLDDLPGEDKSA
jgi:hypothetical protein